MEHITRRHILVDSGEFFLTPNRLPIAAQGASKYVFQDNVTKPFWKISRLNCQRILELVGTSSLTLVKNPAAEKAKKWQMRPDNI